MRTHSKFFLATACATVLVSCATERGPAPTPGVEVAADVTEGPDRVEHSNVVTLTAVVEDIDLAKRLVTLRGPEGKLVTIEADERVKNLPQVRKGDVVQVDYYESLAFQVRKPGEAVPGVSGAEGMETAKPGEKPAGVGARAVTVTTTVEAIDKVKETITLKGPGGQSKTIKVQNPANLEKVKVGDLIEITYTEALAIAVEKPKK